MRQQRSSTGAQRDSPCRARLRRSRTLSIWTSGSNGQNGLPGCASSDAVFTMRASRLRPPTLTRLIAAQQTETANQGCRHAHDAAPEHAGNSALLAQRTRPSRTCARHGAAAAGRGSRQSNAAALAAPRVRSAAAMQPRARLLRAQRVGSGSQVWQGHDPVGTKRRATSGATRSRREPLAACVSESAGSFARNKYEHCTVKDVQPRRSSPQKGSCGMLRASAPACVGC